MPFELLGLDSVSYLDARGGEVGDLKLDTDGWFAFFVLRLHTGQAEVSPHKVFFTTLKFTSTHTHTQWSRLDRALTGSCTVKINFCLN